MTYWVFFVASMGLYEMGPYQGKASCEAARAAVIEINELDMKVSKCVKIDI